MRNSHNISEPIARRVRMSSREIALAVAVTLAAVAFVIAASLRTPPETALIDTSGKAQVHD